jgi:hypothetical protein
LAARTRASNSAATSLGTLARQMRSISAIFALSAVLLARSNGERFVIGPSQVLAPAGVDVQRRASRRETGNHPPGSVFPDRDVDRRLREPCLSIHPDRPMLRRT